jgi:hypothetical protein
VEGADGGETKLDNLTMLCTHHHRLVHEGGFTIQTRRDGRRYFARPNGQPVEVPCANSARKAGGEEVREIGPLYVVDSLSAESHALAGR